jgi:DNA-binding XRE family transcriptional regulator
VRQYKSLIKFDKSKLLALAGDRMMLSREQMAKRLNIDSVYLAQLEDGRRAVDNWYLCSAEKLVREFETTHY